MDLMAISRVRQEFGRQILQSFCFVLILFYIFLSPFTPLFMLIPSPACQVWLDRAPTIEMIRFCSVCVLFWFYICLFGFFSSVQSVFLQQLNLSVVCASLSLFLIVNIHQCICVLCMCVELFRSGISNRVSVTAM